MSKYLEYKFRNMFLDLEGTIDNLKNDKISKKEEIFFKYMECFAHALLRVMSCVREDLPNSKTAFFNLVTDTSMVAKKGKLFYRVIEDPNIFYLSLAMNFVYELIYFGDYLSVINASKIDEFGDLEITNMSAVKLQFFDLLKENPLLAQVYIVGMLSVLRDINNGFKIKIEKDNVKKRFEAFIALYMIEMKKVGIEINEENFSKETVALYKRLSKITENQHDYPADQDKEKVKKN